jgi:inosine-uridine nucleoside N-ribohydrolase
LEGRPVLLDTDISLGTPGAEIDDGAALIALLASGSLDVKGITTVHGNVDAQTAMHNLQRLLAFLHRPDIPLGLGASGPISGSNDWFDVWKSGYGRTPPWPQFQETGSAIDLIVDAARAYPHQLTILAVGPLTNLALALRASPDIVSLVDSLVVMGGSFASSAPEFNSRCDPEAAGIVLNAGWPVRMLGLDVTRRIRFSRADFEALPRDNGALDLLRRQAPVWIDRVEAEGWEQGGCSLHDAVALLALLDDGLFEWREAAVRVEVADPALRGSTTLSAVKGDSSSVRAAVSCQVQACYDALWSLLAGAA